MKAFVLYVANRQFFSFLAWLGIWSLIGWSLLSATIAWNPVLNTIYIVSPEATAYSDCLSTEELEGNFTSATIWFPPLNATGDLNIEDGSPCFTYIPNTGVTGNFIDTMGIIICDDLGICDSTLIIASVEPSDCNPLFEESALVEISIEACFSLGGYCLPIPPSELFNYLITDNGAPYFQGFLACDIDTALVYPTDVIFIQGNAGPYELLNWSENGEDHALSSFNTLSELVDQMNIWDPEGNWVLTGQGKIQGGTNINDYGPLSFVQLIFPFNNFTINLSTNQIPNGVQIAVDTGFHEIIVNQFFTGCRDTVLLQVNCTQVECPQIYYGPDTLNAANCDSLTDLCLEIPLEDLTNYLITDNGSIYTGPFETCRIDETVSYATSGFDAENNYTLESWIFNGQEYSIDLFTSIGQLVDSMRIWDPVANWQFDGQFITGSNFGGTYGDLVVSVEGVVIATSSPNSFFEAAATSVMLDTGYHELIVRDTTNGCAESISVFVDCIPYTGAAFYESLSVQQGLVDTFCFDVSGLTTINSLVNICPDQSNGNVEFIILPGPAPCAVYFGEVLGVDTFCVQICDNTIGFCDTTMLVIEVRPDTDTVYSDLLLSFVDRVCIDTSIFSGTITQFNTFGFQPNLDVNLDDDQYCIEFMALGIGTDTINVQICDDQGYCFLTSIIVNIGPQTIDTILLEVMEGSLDTVCLDTSELFGGITSADNYCLDASGVFVDFDLLDGVCVSAEGLLPAGVDYACIEFCNDFGFCDTTILIVNTIDDPSLDPPIAIVDTASTLTNLPVNISVVENDILNNAALIDFNFVLAPQNGMLVLNPDFSITYIPDEGFCGGVDSFSYLIMTLGGTATANVFVEVNCDEVIIFNGFSPNGDGINDSFKINGLDNYSSNKLWVFNRWGNQVFFRENYQNGDPFDGTWEGNALVDGTYFYRLEVKDSEGNTLNFSGYLSLFR